MGKRTTSVRSMLINMGIGTLQTFMLLIFGAVIVMGITACAENKNRRQPHFEVTQVDDDQTQNAWEQGGHVGYTEPPPAQLDNETRRILQTIIRNAL